MACPLCIELAQDEHVLQTTEHFAVIFNRYPYLGGHLMIVSKHHYSTLQELTPLMRAELMELITDTQTKIMAVFNTESSNIGINTGQMSGASIPGHLHVHIVPRYSGDIGFFNLLARTTPERSFNINAQITAAFKDT